MRCPLARQGRQQLTVPRPACQAPYSCCVAITDERPAATSSSAGAVTVREFLDQPLLAEAEILAGRRGLHRLIRRLNVMTVPDIVQWTKEEEFLLATGYPLPRDPNTFRDLVKRLADRELAGLGIKLDEYLRKVPTIVIKEAQAAHFPLVAIPAATPFDDILSTTFQTIVNRQGAALAKTQEIHDTLFNIALAGRGLDRLVNELAAILHGAAVLIADTEGNILAATGDLSGFDGLRLRDTTGRLDTARVQPGIHQLRAASPRVAMALIRAGSMQHGFVLAVEGVRRFTFVAGAAVEQAALVAALDITREIAISSVERQFASNALHELLTSGPSDLDDAAIRAKRFGWDLRGDLTVLVARPDDQDHGLRPMHGADHHDDTATTTTIARWISAIKAYDQDAAAAGFATEFAAVVSVDQPETAARAALMAVQSATGRMHSLGISRSCSELTEIPRLYQEARTALAVGKRLSGPGTVTSFERLGVHRLLCNVSLSELQLFATETLGPVMSLPEPTRTDLLDTLKTLVSKQFNMAATARTLHYHYNTLRYRVNRLESLLGPFIDQPELSLQICIALQIVRMNEVSI
jgi:PucR family transcriptional regulator, purine catabolism regulatory protein